MLFVDEQFRVLMAGSGFISPYHLPQVLAFSQTPRRMTTSVLFRHPWNPKPISEAAAKQPEWAPAFPSPKPWGEPSSCSQIKHKPKIRAAPFKKKSLSPFTGYPFHTMNGFSKQLVQSALPRYPPKQRWDWNSYTKQGVTRCWASRNSKFWNHLC